MRLSLQLIPPYPGSAAGLGTTLQACPVFLQLLKEWPFAGVYVFAGLSAVLISDLPSPFMLWSLILTETQLEGRARHMWASWPRQRLLLRSPECLGRLHRSVLTAGSAVLAQAEWCQFQQTTTWTEQGSTPQEAGLQNHKSFFLPRKSEGFSWGSLAHCHFHSRAVLVHLEHLLPDSIIQ